MPAVFNTPQCDRCKTGDHLCVYPNPDKSSKGGEACERCAKARLQCSLQTPKKKEPQRRLRSSQRLKRAPKAKGKRQSTTKQAKAAKKEPAGDRKKAGDEQGRAMAAEKEQKVDRKKGKANKGKGRAMDVDSDSDAIDKVRMDVLLVLLS